MWHSSHRAGSSGFGRNVFTPAIALTRTGRLPAIHVIISTSWQHFSNSDPPLVFLKRRQSLRNMTDVVITWGNSSAWMLTTSPILPWAIHFRACK
jgi:hypothetical protein